MATKNDRGRRRPSTTAEVFSFLENQATSLPVNAAPAVRIEGATATIRLFDPIDSWGEWWGMSAKEFAEVVDALPSHISTIELLVNSPGGEVFDGVAICNVIRAHPARTVAIVQGLAASAASFIACAADETVMSRNSTMMIHSARGVCYGTAGDMRDYADLIELINDQIADIYAAKSGRPVDEFLSLMASDTWLTAAEAIEMGLADRTVDDPGEDGETATTNAYVGEVGPEMIVAPTPAAAKSSTDSLDLEIATNAARRRRRTTNHTNHNMEGTSP